MEQVQKKLEVAEAAKRRSDEELNKITHEVCAAVGAACWWFLSHAAGWALPQAEELRTGLSEVAERLAAAHAERKCVMEERDLALQQVCRPPVGAWTGKHV